jgi:hypothetical protein
MKRNVLVFSLLLIAIVSFSQKTEKKKEAKTGWNFGALPAVSYNTDLGLQYGALVNLFNYGDGSLYPKYLHNFYLEASQYTKGSAILRLAYDSEYLIPGIRVTSDLAYLPDEAFDFYGFNGYQSVFNSNFQEDKMVGYKTRMFYKYQNYYFRFKTDIQFPLKDKRFKALVGINLQSYTIGKVDIDKMNKGKKENLLPDTLTLYDKYINWGIITNKEANGGFIPLLKAGIVFDTRDNEPNPMKGMWTEAFLFGAPTFLGSESGFLKFNITHRQYFTLIKRDLSLAYRLCYQGTLAGHAPFYYQTQIETSLMKDQLGLGGNKNLRGINRNRVVGDGFIYGNVELRWKVVHFRWINQNFYIGLNGFLDGGQVVQNVKVENKDAESEKDKYKSIDYYITNKVNEGEINFGAESITDYFNFAANEKPHLSYGAGLHIAMNENFVITFDYGRAFNKQDGTAGTYIWLNYLF